jgi:uncharacterized protein YndB with AHSA1/START domain
MAVTTHVYEIFIRAPRERVWQALIDPADTVQYFHGTRFDSTFEPGATFRNVIVDGERLAADGVVETFDPPRRLVITWHVDDDVEMAAEPPGRVEWTLTPANDDGSVTRVSLRHGDLALSPKTWENVRLGWVEIVDSLKSLLETGQPMPPVVTVERSSDPIEVEAGWHRAQAITANNSVWELLQQDDHTPDEADDLLQRAYTAAYHWRRASGAGVLNRARASWLVSRAHVVLGHGELALHHAQQCAEATERAATDAEDFDHAFASEARARALACLGRLDEAGEAHRRAAAVVIADAEDRTIFESELAAQPWFGLVPA